MSQAKMISINVNISFISNKIDIAQIRGLLESHRPNRHPANRIHLAQIDIRPIDYISLKSRFAQTRRYRGYSLVPNSPTCVLPGVAESEDPSSLGIES